MQERIALAVNRSTDDECAVMLLALEMALVKRRWQRTELASQAEYNILREVEKKLTDAVNKVVG